MVKPETTEPLREGELLQEYPEIGSPLYEACVMVIACAYETIPDLVEQRHVNGFLDKVRNLNKTSTRPSQPREPVLLDEKALPQFRKALAQKFENFGEGAFKARDVAYLIRTLVVEFFADQPREPEGMRSEPIRHYYKPNKNYPWFCADCGYAQHEKLLHIESNTIEAGRNSPANKGGEDEEHRERVQGTGETSGQDKS